jgi:hypothetical protein
MWDWSIKRRLYISDGEKKKAELDVGLYSVCPGRWERAGSGLKKEGDARGARFFKSEYTVKRKISHRLSSQFNGRTLCAKGRMY